MSIQPPTTQQPGKRSLATTLQRAFMDLHIFLYQRTGGVIGGKLTGRPMLLLTTTGRKSGKKRITPIMYFPDGERFILIASNGGVPKRPQWLLNLQTQAQAQVQIGHKNIVVTAVQADPVERQRLWALITAKYQNFADYQKKTTREIPIVILTPQ